MERTHLPVSFPLRLIPRRGHASLSLVRFDPATGALAPVDGPVAFVAVLPEHAVFDRDGATVTVTSFHGQGAQPLAGSVAFFRVDRTGAAPRIVPTGEHRATPRGSHDLAVCY